MADEELLEAWRSGDTAAGHELFRRHFESVYWFFRNKIDGAADDLTQDTFLAVSRNRETVGLRHSFRAYLFAVARSKLIDALRARAPEKIIDPMESSVIDFGNSPSSVIDGGRRTAKLLSALKRLPVDLQTMLELRFFEDASGPELSAMLDIPEGTVRSRLRRAFELLRKYLKEIDGEGGLGDATDEDLERWARQIRRGTEEGDEDGDP